MNGRKRQQPSFSARKLTGGSFPNPSGSDSSPGASEVQHRLKMNELLQTMFCRRLAEEAKVRRDDETDAALMSLFKRLELDKVHLENVQRRLADIVSLSTKHRLLDNVDSNTANLKNELEQTRIGDVLEDLNLKGRRYCDRLHLKNVDIGHTKDRSFNELNDVLKETDQILCQIKNDLKDEKSVLAQAKSLEESCSEKEKIEKSVICLNESVNQAYADTIRHLSSDLSELNYDTLGAVLFTEEQNRKI